MASVFTNNLRLNEMGTGDQSGTWGVTTNTNLQLIGEALGYGTEAISTNATAHSSVVADGTADAARAMYVKYTGTLNATCTITISPNTMKRVQIIENATSGSQSIIIKQGSGSTLTIPNGETKICVLDGAGASAAVFEGFEGLNKAGFAMDTNTSGHILVANGTKFLPVALSGDATIASNGAISLANDSVGADELASNAVVNASVASNAAIDASKIADGSVSNTEFQYLNGVTSAIQTQLDAKLSSDGLFSGTLASGNRFAINTWYNSNEGRNRFYFANSGSTYIKYDTYLYGQNNSGVNKFSVDTSGNGIFSGDITAYGSPSDIALKENVDVIDNALEKVNQLKGITYDLKSDGNRLTGLVAQDLKEVLPEAVYTHKDIETKEEHLAIRYGNTVGLLVEAIKELSEEVKTLKENK